MDCLWSQWPKVAERIRRSRHLLLLLDYDGTLAPIAPSPEQATLPPATKRLLQKLSRSPTVTVALISGRALAELRQLVGLRDLTYIGNHGLEMWRDGRRTVVDIPESSRKALGEILPRLAKLASEFHGAYLEDKGPALSLHYRLVPRDEAPRLKAAFRHEVLPFVHSGDFTLLKGKRVIEVRAGVNWTKGHAARSLVKRMRRRSLLPIYIGDDRTDEDAFRLLSDGITIRVGFHRRSGADYYVRGVREVHSLLQWMSAACA